MFTTICWIAYLIARTKDEELKQTSNIGCVFLATFIIDVTVVDNIIRIIL